MWQVKSPAYQKGLDKVPNLLCSHRVSHLPAPSSGQRHREVELPSHQALRTPRGGSRHPGPEGRFQNVGASQFTEPEPFADRWDVRPGTCTREVTAPLWESGSMEHTSRHATLSSDTLLFTSCRAHKAQCSQARRPP